MFNTLDPRRCVFREPMSLSRRNFLRALGVSATVGVAQFPFSKIASAVVSEPSRERAPGGPILLDSNENAYGASSRVMTAMRDALATANRYPFAQYDPLEDRIAGSHGIKRNRILVGCGSTEILRVATAAFLGRGKKLIVPVPTFEAIEQYSKSTGCQLAAVPLNREFSHDLDAMLIHAKQSPSLVYICNPNNPTATLTPRKTIETFISKLPANTYVLIDEAYHHYAGESAMYGSFIDRPVKDDRVIVSRTFSKIYGLAGLRLGYAVAAPAMIQQMRPYVTMDNINGIVARAAIVALEDQQSIQESIKRNTDDRQEFFNQAMARMLKPIDSHTNFVMMNTDHPAEETIQHFKKNDILIGRRFPAMDTYIRVSLGTPEEMKAFWEAWDRLPYSKMSM